MLYTITAELTGASNVRPSVARKFLEQMDQDERRAKEYEEKAKQCPDEENKKAYEEAARAIKRTSADWAEIAAKFA